MTRRLLGSLLFALLVPRGAQAMQPPAATPEPGSAAPRLAADASPALPSDDPRAFKGPVEVAAPISERDVSRPRQAPVEPVPRPLPPAKLPADASTQPGYDTGAGLLVGGSVAASLGVGLLSLGAIALGGKRRSEYRDEGIAVSIFGVGGLAASVPLLWAGVRRRRAFRDAATPDVSPPESGAGLRVGGISAAIVGGAALSIGAMSTLIYVTGAGEEAGGIFRTQAIVASTVGLATLSSAAVMLLYGKRRRARHASTWASRIEVRGPALGRVGRAPVFGFTGKL